jgi:ABC-type branched-subunit amino acid transport system substrate-binding protein
MKRVLLLVVAACYLVPAAHAAYVDDTPGVTSTTVTIGGTVPITGPAALFGSVGTGADAYFKYVNANGGVNGRKIKYIYLDDAYDPAKTVELTRQLVEQDHVFAIFNTVGTANNLAIRDYLNAAKIPQLFVGTGAAKIGNDFRKDPWTMGYLPSFGGEGAIYGRSIAAAKKPRVAVLYENSDFGKDMTAGLQRGLGPKATSIVAQQSYEPTDPSIDSQMATLHASGANVLVLNVTPQYAILAYVAAHKLRWHPKIYLSSVCISPTVMDIVRANAPAEANNSESIAFVKDPTDKVWKKDPVMRSYRAILKRYAPGANPSDVYNFYGMAAAFTMVDALVHAGHDPTRASLLAAATHLNEVNPFMRPGINIVTSPTDYYPISKAQLVRYAGKRWVAAAPLTSMLG